MVSVVQREWVAKNPRATFKTPIAVEDVLNSRMIAYPFRLLQCCLVTDGGGALILIAAERARDFPQKPVYLLGTGESVQTPMVRISPPRARSRRRPHRLCRGRHHSQRRRPSDDLRRPLFAARGKLCASADLRLRGSGLCAARRGRPIHCRAQHAPASPGRPARPAARGSRSTPMAAASPTCIPACTAPCRRACARCAASLLRRSPAPRSRSATASAACSPPPLRSSCRTSRLKWEWR